MARSCPCDSGERFDACCGPILAGDLAPTAERLMRSRYTAYVRGDGAHLLRTWHATTRPARVEIDPGLAWTGLEVLRTEDGGADDAFGLVEFRAAHADLNRGAAGPDVGVLHEVSRFVRSEEGWQYVRGRQVEAPLDASSDAAEGHTPDETSP